MIGSRNLKLEKSIRTRLYQQTFIREYPKLGLSPLNKLVFCLIFIGVIISILDTEPSLSLEYARVFRYIEFFIAFSFAVEYLLRVIVAGEDSRYRGIRGRVRYCFTPFALIDLLAFLPSIISLGSSDSLLLRIARIARFSRFAKLGQYTRALSHIRNALMDCWRELVLSVCIAIVLLIISATILYFIESDAQPAQFGSIPRALWWSVATLTTVGYGDVYPITILGKICAGFIALTGIGLVSMPTAILAGSFSDQFKAVRQSRSSKVSDT